MSALWSFRCYVSDRGQNEIRASFDQQTAKTKARFSSRIITLSRLPYDEWARNEAMAKDLRGDAAGLREIRFKADGVQQRPIGFRSGELEFTLLLWAQHWGAKWRPSQAFEIAQKRKDEVQASRNRTDELWIALE